ncbi:MAG TPA: methionyl-tRNA formyltransferase [Methylomirabilota bacterium]|nr:methionyl-tRNA formyltransferase [Methylomirabilota bacterium]
MSNRILFFGNERLATGLSTSAPTLRALVDAGYDVVAVVVAQKEVGKSRKGRELEIVQVAEAVNLPALVIDDLAAAKDQLASYKAEAAVLIAYGKIVPQSVIDVFPRGIVNIHPSLLPKHRGPTPIESVILSGEAETGVALMSLAAEMDAGPVYDQQAIKLNGNETKQELADQLGEIGKDLVIKNLPAILDGSLQPKPQADDATYDELIDKEDGVIDWQKPAGQLEREVRAYLDWPRSRTSIGSTDVIITKSHVAEGSGTPGTLLIEAKQLGVYCGEGLLVIDNLIPAGKKEMPAQAFLSGYQSRS